MTIKQALIAVLRVNVPDNSVEKALLDQDLTGSATYAKTDAENVDRCVIDLLHGLLSEPDVSEGGYSVKYDRKAVTERLLLLAKKYDVTDILDEYKPSVTGKSPW